MSRELLRKIRPVEHYLERLEDLVEKSSREFTLECIRHTLEDLRQQILQGEYTDTSLNIEESVRDYWNAVFANSLCPVINATGIVIHTNLGRAPLGTDAIREIVSLAGGYSNLEYNLDQGKRGRRDVHSEKLLQDLLGCEAATVVNNCAAALLIVLDELAKGGEVLISRGELIEIGGGFRIPDVCQRSGALLREVGTTNRTRVVDYELAINEKTRLIMRVHPSNYRITGFTEKPALKELVDLAQKHNLPLIEDIGSGCLLDLKPYGIDEPNVRASICAGVSLTTFSGDKLLGGPQAGIIAGRREYIERIKSNPLMRALRVDKLTYAALGATLLAYRTGRAERDLPVLRMLTTDISVLRKRSRAFIARARKALPAAVKLELVDGVSYVGGGCAPQNELKAVLIAVSGVSISALEAQLRSANPPVVARIEGDRLLIDLRTVRGDEEKGLLLSLKSSLNSV